MIIRNCHNNASERHNLNNPRQTKCSLGIDNQTDNSVSERRDFIYMPITDNHLIINTNTFLKFLVVLFC